MNVEDGPKNASPWEEVSAKQGYAMLVKFLVAELHWPTSKSLAYCFLDDFLSFLPPWLPGQAVVTAGLFSLRRIPTDGRRPRPSWNGQQHQRLTNRS